MHMVSSSYFVTNPILLHVDEGLPNQFEINMHWGYDDEALRDLNICIDSFEYSEYNVQQQHDGSLNQMQQTAPGTFLH
jgi:hypothetical protein